jgi:hypothetical protein
MPFGDRNQFWRGTVSFADEAERAGSTLWQQRVFPMSWSHADANADDKTLTQRKARTQPSILSRPAASAG